MVKLGINKIGRVQQGLGRLLRPERDWAGCFDPRGKGKAEPATEEREPRSTNLPDLLSMHFAYHIRTNHMEIHSIRCMYLI